MEKKPELIQLFENNRDLTDFSYQKNLTPKLDELEGDFTQDIINYIVLWKVNRYAQITDEALEILNKVSSDDTVLDVDKTRKILVTV